MCRILQNIFIHVSLHKFGNVMYCNVMDTSLVTMSLAEECTLNEYEIWAIRQGVRHPARSQTFGKESDIRQVVGHPARCRTSSKESDIRQGVRHPARSQTSGKESDIRQSDIWQGVRHPARSRTSGKQYGNPARSCRLSFDGTMLHKI